MQRDLQLLGAVWLSATSCFRSADSVPHAEPSRDDLTVVLPQLDGADFGIVGAAFSALRSFAVVCRHSVYGALPPSIWDVPDVAIAVKGCLRSPHAGARLRAIAFVSEFPSSELHEALVLNLEDPLFTVRWRAVRALALLGADVELIQVLCRSTPTAFDPNRHLDYLAALEAVGITLDDVRERNGG